MTNPTSKTIKIPTLKESVHETIALMCNNFENKVVRLFNDTRRYTEQEDVQGATDALSEVSVELHKFALNFPCISYRMVSVSGELYTHAFNALWEKETTAIDVETADYVHHITKIIQHVRDVYNGIS